MIDFTCPGCQLGLTSLEQNVGQKITCPHCGAIFLVPPPRRLLNRGVLGQAERETVLETDKENQATASPSEPSECQEWIDEYRPKKVAALLVSLTLVAGLVLIVFIIAIIHFKGKSAIPTAPKNEALSRRQREPLQDPEQESQIQQTKEEERVLSHTLPSTVVPLNQRVSKDDPEQDEKPNPRKDDDAVALKPKITSAEIEEDQKVVLRYYKANINQTQLKDLQWKGPWPAVDGNRKGKLYRLRASLRVVNARFKNQDKQVSYYFFLYDDAVSRSETDPGDLSKVKICKVLDTEPLVPPAPAELPSQAIQYLSDMDESDVRVAEGRFAKNGELGYMAGNPPSGRILVNRKESPHGISMCPDSNDYASARFMLDRTARTFIASAALNDSAGAVDRPPGVGKIPTPLTFKVLGDGKILWKSRPVDLAKKVQDCKVDVATVKVLELRIDCPGSGVNAQPVWLEPRVILKSEK